MDWKVFLTAFNMIFLAELGDKTQLATISLTCESDRPLAVFLGTVLALAVVSLSPFRRERPAFSIPVTYW